MTLLLGISLFGSSGIDPTQITAYGEHSVFSLAMRVVQIALGLIGGIAVIYVLIGGFQYIVAGGDPSGQASAKNTIRSAIIGLIIVLLAFSLTNFLLQTLQFRATIKTDINQGIPKTNPSQPDIIQ